MKTLSRISWIWMILFVMMSSCRSEKPVPLSGPSLKSEINPTAQTPEPSVCEQIAADQAKLTATLRSIEQTLYPDNKIEKEPFGWCRETSAGAWAILLNAVEPEGNYAVRASWSLVHFDKNGGRTDLAPASPDFNHEVSKIKNNYDYEIGGGHSHIDLPELFDFDNDGEPEVFLKTRISITEGGDWSWGRLWTFKNGKIFTYKPAASINIEKLEDFDSDGRPDLLTRGPYDEESSENYSAFPYRATGPLIAVRSLENGAFSFEDPRAVNRTAESCKEFVDSPLITVGEEGWILESESALAAAVCARMRGETIESIISRMRAQYRELMAKPEFVGKEVEVAPENGLFKNWISIDPPAMIPSL